MGVSQSQVTRYGASGLVAATASTALFPFTAFAAEGIEAILPNMNEFIPMLVAFILLWIVLAKFGWPLFDGILEKRRKTIVQALEQSEESRAEAERVLAEYKAQLADAKTQAAQVVAEAKEAGEEARAEITKQAQQEAANMIEKARVAIEAEKQAAMKDLQGTIADLSVDVASRLVSADLSDAEHRAIIERYLNEAGSFHAN